MFGMYVHVYKKNFHSNYVYARSRKVKIPVHQQGTLIFYLKHNNSLTTGMWCEMSTSWVDTVFCTELYANVNLTFQLTVKCWELHIGTYYPVQVYKISMSEGLQCKQESGNQ